MKEDFCTYDQAIRLKKLGFDWECGRYYCAFDNGVDIRFWSINPPCNHNGYNGTEKIIASAPSLSQAAKWLREVKDYHINILYDKDCWLMQLVDMGVRRKNIGGVFQAMADANKASGIRKSYETALSAGLDAALKLLEEKLSSN